jgi:hypothetical protein
MLLERQIPINRKESSNSAAARLNNWPFDIPTQPWSATVRTSKVPRLAANRESTHSSRSTFKQHQ